MLIMNYFFFLSKFEKSRLTRRWWASKSSSRGTKNPSYHAKYKGTWQECKVCPSFCIGTFIMILLSFLWWTQRVTLQALRVMNLLISQSIFLNEIMCDIVWYFYFIWDQRTRCWRYSYTSFFAFINQDSGIDLSLLSSVLLPYAQITETDEPWEFDKLFVKISSELQSEMEKKEKVCCVIFNTTLNSNPTSRKMKKKTRRKI